MSVAFSGDSKLVASGSHDRTVKLWDATTGKEVRTLEGHGKHVRSVAFSGDSKLVASGSGDTTVKLWDATTGKEVRTLEIGTTLTNISVDTTCSQLLTEIGPIKLGSNANSYAYTDDQAQAQPQKARRYGYGLSPDRSWITWNEHNLLWLPPDYRPSSSAVSSSPSTVTIGCRSGRVLTIGFSGPPSLS
jgi:WD40 repeat protein